MKHLLLLTLLASSFAANAMLITNNYGRDSFCAQMDESGITATCYVISTTTSLPTMIVEGQEMDLNSDEASMRLMAEANSDVEPVIATKIASDLNVSVQDVLAKTLELSALGDVTVSAVKSELSK